MGTSIWARFAVETQAVVLLQEKQSLGTEPTTSKISKKRINQWPDLANLPFSPLTTAILVFWMNLPFLNLIVL